MKNAINQNITVGIDTGKFQLDIYIRPLDIYFTVNNDEDGIKKACNNEGSTISECAKYISDGKSITTILS